MIDIFTPTNIKWVPSPNYGSRGGIKPVAIVMHIMAGSLSGTDSWFSNPKSQVSAHFGIGKNGEVHQYVKLQDAAWANGVVDQPDLSVPWIADAVRNNIWMNALTVSIEHEGYPGDPWTEAMFQRDVELCLWLNRVLGIPLDRQHIVGHYQIDSVNRKDCPGPSFPWDRLLSTLETYTNGRKPPAQPTPPSPTVDLTKVPKWARDAVTAAVNAGVVDTPYGSEDWYRTLVILYRLGLFSKH